MPDLANPANRTSSHQAAARRHRDTFPQDRISRYNERLADYRQMGIPNVWVVDPTNRLGYDCSTAAWLPNEEFRVTGSPIFLRLNDLWSELEGNNLFDAQG